MIDRYFSLFCKEIRKPTPNPDVLKIWIKEMNDEELRASIMFLCGYLGGKN